MFAEWGVGVLVGKRVVAMRSPSAKRSCMVSAWSIIIFLVLILSGRVDVVFVKGVFCSPARSSPRSSGSSEVDCCIASLMSSDHCASKGCGIGNLNRMGLG